MANNSIFLTPGPSELYFTVGDHIQNALQDKIPSISHRSLYYQDIHRFAVEQVKKLLNVPDDYHLVFTNSATEVWERLIQNCVEKETYHFVNGSFSTRFHEFSGLLGKKANKTEAEFGYGFNMQEVNIPDSAEMICFTQNETSSGVQTPKEDIYAIRSKHPEALIAVDAVSAVPFLDIDFNMIDSLFFSVQKGMGLPAGLGVWIFNEKCVKKSEQLLSKGQSIGTYHSIPSLLKNGSKNMTPATPNVLGIYVLAKVAEDMNRKGIDVIRRETIYKSTLMYSILEKHPDFEILVEKESHRSNTVIVAKVLNGSSSNIIKYLSDKGLNIGSGYSKYKNSQIRIANFPTHSKETFLQLGDLINEYTFSESNS